MNPIPWPQLRSLLEHLGAPHGLTLFGACAYDAALAAIPCRAASRLPPSAQTIVSVLLPYYVGSFPHRNVARYALPPDYHVVGASLLRGLCAELAARWPEEAFEPFCDISPVREVEAAVRGGLGVRGRNGLLINPVYGSYTFIGEIVTTLGVHALPEADARGACLDCGRCASACPGGALTLGAFDCTRCLSHLTQKKRLDEAGQRAVAEAGMAWGCDVCGDVCPMNRSARYSPVAAFYTGITAVLTRENLRGALAGHAYEYKGAAVLERNLGLTQRASRNEPPIKPYE